MSRRTINVTLDVRSSHY